MSTAVKKYLKLIWLYFKLNLSAAMEYRVSFLTQAIGMMLSNASFIFFWWVIYRQTSSIGGYTFKDVMLLWSLASSAFGLALVIFGNVRSVGAAIINGDLDVYLLQPKNVFINLICSRTSFSSWGDFIYGFILFIVVYGADVGRLLLFALFVFLGSLLIGSILAIAETLTFFIGNSNIIARQVMDFLISFMIYPESIYRKFVRIVIYTVIPAGFVVFIPARIITAFNIKSILPVILADIAYILLSYGFFKLGLKRYESGNRIGARI